MTRSNSHPEENLNPNPHRNVLNWVERAKATIAHIASWQDQSDPIVQDCQDLLSEWPKNPNGISNLELILTDDLLDELLKRCDHGIVALLRENEKKPDTISFYRRKKGDSFTCAGLAFHVADLALKEFEADTQKLDA